MSDGSSLPSTSATSPLILRASPAKNIVLVVDRKNLHKVYAAHSKRTLGPHLNVQFAASHEEVKLILSTRGAQIALVISGGVLTGEVVWSSDYRSTTISSGAKTAADVMRLMDAHGVHAPFILVSGACSEVLKILPRPPDASFTKCVDMKNIMDRARALLLPN